MLEFKKGALHRQFGSVEKNISTPLVVKISKIETGLKMDDPKKTGYRSFPLTERLKKRNTLIGGEI